MRLRIEISKVPELLLFPDIRRFHSTTNNWLWDKSFSNHKRNNNTTLISGKMNDDSDSSIAS